MAVYSVYLHLQYSRKFKILLISETTAKSFIRNFCNICQNLKYIAAIIFALLRMLCILKLIRTQEVIRQFLQDKSFELQQILRSSFGLIGPLSWKQAEMLGASWSYLCSVFLFFPCHHLKPLLKWWQRILGYSCSQIAVLTLVYYFRKLIFWKSIFHFSYIWGLFGDLSPGSAMVHIYFWVYGCTLLCYTAEWGTTHSLERMS